MTDFLAIAMFLIIIAAVYVLLLSEHGIPMHRYRDWQARHDQMDRDLRDLSEARDTRPRADSEHPSESKVHHD